MISFLFRPCPLVALILRNLIIINTHHIRIVVLVIVRLEARTALQTLHLPRLQTTEILLGQVHTTHLVTNSIHADILLELDFFVRPLALLQGRLHDIVRRLVQTTNLEVQLGAYLIQFDTGKFVTTLLSAQLVPPQMNHRRQTLRRFLGRNHQRILQSLDIDLIRLLPLEHISKHALENSMRLRGRIVPRAPRKNKHRP